MTVSELVVKLLFQSDKMKVDDFVKSVKELNIQSLLSLSAFGTLAVEMKNMMVWASQSALVMAKFGTETGLSADQMGMWANVAKVAGVSAQDAFQGVMTLQKNIANVQRGWASAGPFQQMGIVPSSDTFKTLKEIMAWAKQNKNPVDIATIFSQVGIPVSMMNMIDTLTDPVKLAHIEQMNVEWKKSVEALEPMRQEFTVIKEQFEQMGMILAKRLGPHLATFAIHLEKILALMWKYKWVIVGMLVIFEAVFMPQVLIMQLLLIAIEQVIEKYEHLKDVLKAFGIAGFMGVGGFSSATVPSMSGRSAPAGRSGFGMNQNTFHFVINGASSPENLAVKMKQILTDIFSDTLGQEPAPSV